MVDGRESPIFAELEFGGFLDVPHRVSINKSASYGFPWNRIGNCAGPSESYAHSLQMLGEEWQKTPRICPSPGTRHRASGMPETVMGSSLSTASPHRA